MCVSSQFRGQERARAPQQPRGGGWLTLSKDGRYDEAIDVELERLKSEAVEEWFLRDVQPEAARIGLISQLVTSEEVKNRLREKYLPPPSEGAGSAAA